MFKNGYKHLNAWLKKMEKEIPKYNEINWTGAKAFGDYFKANRI